MTQITGIGFSNFRIFKDSNKDFFDFKPISIFTGTNSSGKSSIFKGLLLLSNNFYDLFNLDFSGEKHKLGTFSNTINRNSTGKPILFQLLLDVNKNKSLFYSDLLFTTEYVQDKNNTERGFLKESTFVAYDKQRSTYSDEDILVYVDRDDKKDFLYFNLDFYLRKLREELFPEFRQIKPFLQAKEDGSYSFSTINGTVDFSLVTKYIHHIKVLSAYCNFDFHLVSRDKLSNILSSYPKSSIDDFANRLEEKLHKSLIYLPLVRGTGKYETGSELVTTYFDLLNHYRGVLSLEGGLFKRFTGIDINFFLDEEVGAEYASELKDSLVADIINIEFFDLCKDLIIPELISIMNAIRVEMLDISYIEGVRANSQRLYTNQSQGTSFNQLLIDIGQVWPSLLISEEDEVTPINFVKKWIKKFGIGDDINIKRHKGIATEVIIECDGNAVDLVDLGYGVTQFLPILLNVAFKLKLKGSSKPYFEEKEEFEIEPNNGPLLLIEEPESNLHPKLQSLLADFFVDVAKHFNVTLLIETHSEYLIRRLQVLTASGDVKPEDSVIYYLDGNIPSDSDKFVRKININPDGSLTNDFGPGFIDEATNWKMELMRLKNAQLQNLN